MGQYASKQHWSLEHYTFPHLRKENWPHPRHESPYDPLYGFPNGRKPREMIATDEEMELAKLEYRERDYCAHLIMNYRKCYKENSPFLYKCNHEKHQWNECQFEDMVLRMKEWERERRLKEREMRKEKAQLSSE